MHNVRMLLLLTLTVKLRDDKIETKYYRQKSWDIIED